MSALPRAAALVGGAVLLAAAAPRLPAQALRLGVVDEVGGAPVAGALVNVMDTDGRVVVTTTTRASGSRLVPLPRAGTYRVHVRRVGFEPYTSAPTAVAAGDTLALTVRARIRPVVLSTVRTTAATACGRADGADGADGDRHTVRLWDQLRTALALTELARTDDAPPAGEVVQFVTRLAGDRRTVLRHTVQPPRPARPRPFATYTAAELSARGYVRHTPAGPEFTAPDERVLLSDAFGLEHCFRYVVGEGEEAGLVGIGFTPTPARAVPEIAGVLWADARTAALRYLDFWYVDDRLPQGARGEGRAGGEVHFDTLPDGRWIVRAWQLRMPLVRLRARTVRTSAGSITGTQEPVLAGYVEVGALARVGDGGAGDTMLAAAGVPRRLADLRARTRPGAIRLVTFDSLLGRPLAGARVWLQQQPDSAALLFQAGTDVAGPIRSTYATADTIVVTGRDGAVEVAGLAAGRYVARWTHPDLYQDQLQPPARELTLTSGAAVVDTAATASFATLWAACGRVPAGRVGVASAGIIHGIVRDAPSNAPAAGVTVVAEWPPTRGARERAAAARTNDDGRFAICGVPVGRELRISASAEGRVSPPSTLLLGARRVAERDLWLPIAGAAPPGR